ncbi:hypothetical protein DFJ67_0547 [Asanoa ferruginea]|uniref:Regulatory LuxR family protein n=1 Tax=Asanoa ferruginea TaxID=53367 RepID=A0A3D9ZB27_9ACTN|nr:hypothetical protein DFJ67_0547 [Asanoa ferruginea]GIF50796.1 hypothetical protein Afe04nite_53350 [Asanoa ferruginea]
MRATGRLINDLERTLLRLLLDGHTVATAAATIFVSTRTAEAMLARLRRETGAPTLYALGAIAQRLGWHDSAA